MTFSLWLLLRRLPIQFPGSFVVVVANAVAKAVAKRIANAVAEGEREVTKNNQSKPTSSRGLKGQKFALRNCDNSFTSSVNPLPHR